MQSAELVQTDAATASNQRRCRCRCRRAPLHSVSRSETRRLGRIAQTFLKSAGGWTVANLNLLPRPLTAVQTAELNTAIANLNANPNNMALASQLNQAATKTLQTYSLTMPEADTILNANIAAAEADVRRRLLANGVTQAEWMAMAGSRELAAMVDMRFNGVFQSGSARAFASGNRAQLWYEARYGNS